MNVTVVRCALSAMSSCVFASTVVAGTITHTVVIPSRKIPWTEPAMVPAFDQALGRLTAVELSLRGRCHGSARYENLRTRPQVVQANFATASTLMLPNGEALLSPSASMSFVDVLPGFDNVLDFDGRSGRRHDDVVARLDGDRRLNSASSLAWFESSSQLPKRSVRLGVRMESSALSSDGSAHAWDQSSAAAVVVTYHYDEAR